MKYFLNAVFLVVCFLFLTNTAEASFNDGFDTSPKASITTKASVTHIVAGQPFQLLFTQDIVKDWHSYWINPGDSGEPTQFDIKAPTDFNIGETLWQAPERIPYLDLMNFGYKDQAHFITTITPPHVLNGDSYTVSGTLRWLICHDICIPEQQDFTITLPVGTRIHQDNTKDFTTALAKIPTPLMQEGITFAIQDGQFNTVINAASLPFFAQDITSFFPTEWGLIENTADQKITRVDNTLILSSGAGSRDLSTLPQTDIILKTKTGESYQISAGYDSNLAINTGEASSLIHHMLLALIGGLILNLMPCVFPVLSLKALSLIGHQEKTTHYRMMSGLAYTLGVLISFAVFATIILTLRSLGTTLGWGFHLQNPYNILFLSYLMFVIGLNLLGTFNINMALPARFANFGQSHSGSHWGSFSTGILTAVLATPCTAPFMASAIGYASVQPALQSLLVFISLGLGLALPYLILTCIPRLQKALPKPGAWMERFKKILSIPMFLTALWLLWVLYAQASFIAVSLASAGLLILYAALTRTKPNKLIHFIFIIGICATFILLPQDHAVQKSRDHAISYSAGSLTEALQSDQPILVNMTADWCITCKVNEKTSLNPNAITALQDQHNLIYILGDWTNENDDITAYLAGFKRNGVPLYVFYPAPIEGTRPEPHILPQILTPSTLNNLF